MITRFDRSSNLHGSVAAGNFIFVAGLVGAPGGMKEQTEGIFQQLDDVLSQHKLDRDAVVSATIFITDMKLKPEMNEVWEKAFRPEDLPTRATIGVADLGPGVLIEIVFTLFAVRTAP